VLRRLVRGACFAALALGVIWILQGIGVLPGSVMTGRSEWALAGAGLLAAGAALAFWLARSAPPGGSL
jgi:hypothetical protein